MTFWKSWVRNPALAVSGASLVLGLSGTLDWAPALAAAAFAATTAKAAGLIAARHAAQLESETAAIFEFPSRDSARRYDRAA